MMSLGIFLLLFIQTALATEPCTPINHVTKVNSPYSRLPVNDQDGTGICYAITGSELLNYRLIESGQTTQPVVHPVWMALKASRRRLDAGLSGEAINAIRTAGICPFQNVEDSINAVGKNAGLSGTPLVAFLELYSVNLQRQLGNGAQKQRPVTPEMIQRAFQYAQSEVEGRCDGNVLWDQLLPQLAALNETSVQLFSRLLSDACASPEPLNAPEPVSGFWETLEESNRQMTLYLNDGPMEITYCNTFFDDPSYVGITWPGSGIKSDCGNHSSVLVGRKEIGGSCHYLLRNSWGTAWDTWNSSPGTKCLCKNKTTGAYVDECSEATHNDGNHSVEACYFSQDTVNKNTYSITSMYGS